MADGNKIKKPLREPLKAFEKTKASPPAFSMRAKTAFGDAERYLRRGGDTAGPIDANKFKYEPPKWSIGSRNTHISKPANYPGPGEYPVPSTMLKSHPTLPSPPKGWNFSTTKRADSMGPLNKDSPGPLAYRVEQSDKVAGTRLHQSAPAFSIRTKLKDESSYEQRPGCQKYWVQNMNQHGPYSAPAYTIARRQDMVARLEKRPGPGDHKPLHEHSSRTQRQPTYAFGTMPRFKPEKEVEDTPF
mmetsp:Transcript_57418/g.134659  ORF Transcript_57418/g.134659 Transcript_57418/m.134659 type:complete len:244 (+) Transcript_57418:147-878(+)